MFGMWKGFEVMKIPVYFRTRDQLLGLADFISKTNESIRERIGWSSASWIRMTSKYTEKSPIWNNIPKSKPGDKKYMAVIRTNKEQMERLNIHLEQMLSKLDGIELVNTKDNEPRYKGETTTTEFLFTTEEQFKTIIRDLDAAFGQRNWRMRSSAKGMQRIIKRLQEAKQSDNTWMYSFIKPYENGVPVRIIVYEANANIDKYLFKARLKA
jgi:hypothetical protein